MDENEQTQILVILKGVDFKGSGIPTHTQGMLERYALHRLDPGSFGTAILAGDIDAATNLADSWNRQSIREIDHWIRNTLPKRIRGSYPKVYQWCRK